jgi:hypothetical protein
VEAWGAEFDSNSGDGAAITVEYGHGCSALKNYTNILGSIESRPSHIYIIERIINEDGIS